MTSIFRRKGRAGFTLKYRDAKGKDRFRSFRTRALAEQKALDLRANPDPGQRITLKDYAATWLRHAEGRIRRGTFSGYECSLVNHLIPALGHLHLTEITRGHVKDMVADKLAAGLGRRTVANIHAVLHNLLAEAIEDGYLSINPAAHRGRGGAIGPSRAEVATKIKAFDAGQLRAFLEAAGQVVPDRLLLFRVLAFTGLRLGEALALRWEDVDEAGHKLRVERGWTRQRIEPTKTPAGVRDVDLPAGLVVELAASSKAAQTAALKAGRPRAPWIFASRGGGPQHHGRIEQDFKRALAGARLPQHFTPHCLRHTFASLHLQAGVSIYYAQRQLGHASIKMTVDLYGRWLPAGNAAAADRLEAVISGGGDRHQQKHGLSPDLSLEHAEDAS